MASLTLSCVRKTVLNRVALLISVCSLYKNFLFSGHNDKSSAEPIPAVVYPPCNKECYVDLVTSEWIGPALTDVGVYIRWGIFNFNIISNRNISPWFRLIAGENEKHTRITLCALFKEDGKRLCDTNPSKEIGSHAGIVIYKFKFTKEAMDCKIFKVEPSLSLFNSRFSQIR